MVRGNLSSRHVTPKINGKVNLWFSTNARDDFFSGSRNWLLFLTVFSLYFNNITPPCDTRTRERKFTREDDTERGSLSHASGQKEIPRDSGSAQTRATCDRGNRLATCKHVHGGGRQPSSSIILRFVPGEPTAAHIETRLIVLICVSSLFDVAAGGVYNSRFGRLGISK